MAASNERYDLRSRSIDFTRDRKTKQKWGPRALKGHIVVREDRAGANNKVKPRNERDHARDRPQYLSSYNKRESTAYARQRQSLKKAIPFACHEDNPYQKTPPFTSDNQSSGESASNSELEEEEDFMYSYDNQTGPVDGRQVFEKALERAEVEFEDGQTLKLVNDEYDIVTNAEREVGGTEEQTMTVDEDYELV